MVYPDDFINNVVCGKFEDILPQMPDNSFDLVLVDPPYGVLKTNSAKWDKVFDIGILESELHRVMKPETALAMFSSWQLLFSLMQSWTKLKFKYEVILRRRSYLGIGYTKRPINIHEYFLVWSKGPRYSFYEERPIGHFGEPYSRGANKRSKTGVRNFSASMDEHKHVNLDGFRKPVSVMDITPKHCLPHNERTPHPTQKEVAFLSRWIEALCPVDGIVLDCFAGSGSTLVAAKATNRRFVGVEESKEYCDMARSRMETQDE